MVRFICSALAATLIGTSSAAAGTTVDLAADATRSAPNDLVRVVLYAEASGASPGELARRINGEIAEALKSAKAVPGVTVKSGSSGTTPIYGKSRGIESWRMRSELNLESTDTAAIAELAGRLQNRLALGGVVQTPAEATRKRVEDEATRDALAAFQARAAVIAAALGKPYRIRSLNVGQSGIQPPMPMVRGAMFKAADAAPLPLEAGDSPLTVTVSGQIELQD